MTPVDREPLVSKRDIGSFIVGLSILTRQGQGISKLLDNLISRLSIFSGTFNLKVSSAICGVSGFLMDSKEAAPMMISGSGNEIRSPFVRMTISFRSSLIAC